MTETQPTVPIVWVGPAGHRASKLFQSADLVPGERYWCPADVAEVLVTRHPEFWAREAPKAEE